LFFHRSSPYLPRRISGEEDIERAMTAT
jgi:hypothetical protein